MPKSDFPKDYLIGLELNHRQKVEAALDPAERLLMYSGARLNWVGEYINDGAVDWQLKLISVDSITLTRTGPDWDKIIIDKAEGDPAKLRTLLKLPEIALVFKDSQFVDIPILVRKDGDALKVLDGMNRTIAAIRDNILQIRAYIGTRSIDPTPIVEPHVIYDFIRAYEQRGGDEEDFKGGLRFLISAYSNAKGLLETRFGPQWVRGEKTQKVIREVLGEK